MKQLLHKQIAGAWWGFPGGSAEKGSAYNAGDTRDVGLIPHHEDPLEEENGNPFQYSYLKNPMDRGAWQAIIHGGHKRHNWATDAHAAQVPDKI